MRTKKNQNSGLFIGLFILFLAVARQTQAGVLEDVRNQFNRDKGAPRLVLLVSPT